MTPKAIKIIAVILLAVVVVAGFAWWWLFTIPISQAQLQRLTPGMTPNQVYAVLGAANQTNTSNRVTYWYYSRRPAVLALVVSFDYSGFKEYVID